MNRRVRMVAAESGAATGPRAEYRRHEQGHSGSIGLIYERVRLGIMSALAMNDQAHICRAQVAVQCERRQSRRSCAQARRGGLCRVHQVVRGTATETLYRHHGPRAQSPRWTLSGAHRGGHQGDSPRVMRTPDSTRVFLLINFCRAKPPVNRYACRNHHGRQRALGHAAGACRAPRATSRAPKRCAPWSRAAARAGIDTSDAVRILSRQLGPSGGGNRSPDVFRRPIIFLPRHAAASSSLSASMSLAGAIGSVESLLRSIEQSERLSAAGSGMHCGSPSTIRLNTASSRLRGGPRTPLTWIGRRFGACCTKSIIPFIPRARLIC